MLSALNILASSVVVVFDDLIKGVLGDRFANHINHSIFATLLRKVLARVFGDRHNVQDVTNWWVNCSVDQWGILLVLLLLFSLKLRKDLENLRVDFEAIHRRDIQIHKHEPDVACAAGFK